MKIILALALLLSFISAQAQLGLRSPGFVAGLHPIGVAAYDPATDGNVVEWLKADAITASDNDVVEWVASIGQSATNPVSMLRPVYKTNQQNGKPAVHFDTTTFLQTSSFGIQSQPYEIVIVFKYFGATGNNQIIFSGVVGGGDTRFANRPTANWGAYFGNGSDYIQFGTSDNNWHILILEINGASSKWAFDGVADATFSATPGPDAVSAFTLGSYLAGAFGADVYIGELIVRSGTFTSGQKAAAFVYANTRWAVY